jgi:transposase
MHTKSLIKRLLRIEKIAIEKVDFETLNDEEILVIKARPMSRDTNRCPKCGKRCKGYDSSNKVRRWRSLDFLGVIGYMSKRLPQESNV